jgi:5-methylcytosine-specific restriction endonuclease McrA
MTTKRGTTNRNARGNTADRAARRAFLLANFGNGTTAPCYRCGIELTNDTITVDRIVPGRDGGRYTRDNIRPACAPCNSETGGMLARREVITVELPELDEESAHRKHVLSFDCWCSPVKNGDRYHHQGDASAGWLTEAEAWISTGGAE